MRKSKLVLLFLVISSVVISGCIKEKSIPANKPPHATISGPECFGYPPFNVSFSLSAYDEDGYIESWKVDCNEDGIYDYSGEGDPPDSVNYTYTQVGEYTAKFVVVDNNGSTTTSTFPIIVKAPNKPPTCSLDASPSSGYAPLLVSFSLNASDSDGYITSWKFDANGDGIADYNGNGKPPSTLSYTYSNAGTYIANLTVVDNNSSFAYATITIAVYQHEAKIKNISIASWNLQIFGVKKASNETLLNYYADKIDDYDICGVQEIRDKTGTAIQKLAAKLPEYHYIISQRAGTTSSKEQYAIFYDDKATLISYHDYTPDLQDEFERPPLEAEFKANNWTFILYTIHTKPSNVYQELTNLENLIGEPDGDTIVLGDLNADGSYYDEDNIQHFTTWHWVITNDMDTTVAASNNTYDRIIINQYTENNFIEAGVMNDVTPEESDHYLVYSVFRTDVY